MSVFEYHIVQGQGLITQLGVSVQVTLTSDFLAFQMCVGNAVKKLQLQVDYVFRWGVNRDSN